MINSINFSKTKISFGSIERSVYKDTKTEEIKYRNNTYLFRNDLDWDKVIDEITKDNTPKKIYCYACSDGSEPYSIAIILISKLGYKKAQTYFPIIARDIDKKMIDKTKQGKIGLSDNNIKKINLYQSKADINFFDEYKPANHDIFCYEGIVSDELRKCVDFEVGDICKEACDIDYNNTIIFFRNALPYLSQEDRSMVLAAFARNLTNKTAIVIGDFDKRVMGRVPLFFVQNHTYGLTQPTENYYQGTRLKNMRRLHCFHLTDDYPIEYIATTNQTNKKSDIKKYNNFIKSKIISNNQKGYKQKPLIRGR